MKTVQDETRKKIEERIKLGLEKIRALENIPAMMDASMILGVFRHSGYAAALNLDEIAAAFNESKWFGDKSQIQSTLDLLEKEEHKLIYHHPDGKYVFRDFD
jgi:hypothetical protein